MKLFAVSEVWLSLSLISWWEKKVLAAPEVHVFWMNSPFIIWKGENLTAIANSKPGFGCTAQLVKEDGWFLSERKWKTCSKGSKTLHSQATALHLISPGLLMSANSLLHKKETRTRNLDDLMIEDNFLGAVELYGMGSNSPAGLRGWLWPFLSSPWLATNPPSCQWHIAASLRQHLCWWCGWSACYKHYS